MSEHVLRTYLIRHGEAVGNREGRYIGLSDRPLTSTGRAQAQALARACAPLGLEGVYSSPLERARSTAAAIASHCALDLILDEQLSEMSFGDWEALTPNEIRGRSKTDREALAAWHADPSTAPPGGESLASLAERGLAFIHRRRVEGRRAIAVVSHVGPIKALLCSALGLPIAGSSRTFLDPATITVVDWGPQPLLRLFNSHAHLGWTEARWMGETLRSVDT